MTGEERRRKIIQIIKDSVVSGGELAKQLQVSRQVIVQDIALLRAGEYEIISTSKGYTLPKTETQHQRVIPVHHDTEHM